MNAKDQGGKADVSIHPAHPKGSGTMTNRHTPNDPLPGVKEEPTGPVGFHRIGRQSPPFQDPRKPRVVLEGRQGRVVLQELDIIKAELQGLGEPLEGLLLLAE